MSENIEWGPAIAVDGKRPGWLKQTDTVLVQSIYGWLDRHLGGPDRPLESWKWSASFRDGRILAIKLPADHPHYRQTEAHGSVTATSSYLDASAKSALQMQGYGLLNPQPTPQADTKPDLTARMEALVRKLATWTWVAHTGADKDYAEARAIVALLPEPVDPDLIEAREMVAGTFDGGTKSLNGDAVRAGARDQARDVQLTLAAIKRGRELALAGETGK